MTDDVDAAVMMMVVVMVTTRENAGGCESYE